MNKYKKLEKVIDDYARVYNYLYSSENDDVKYYEFNSKEIKFVTDNASNYALSEILSLGYNLMQELGLDINLIVKDNNDVTSILDYLEVAYESGDDYKIMLDNATLGNIKVTSSITLTFDTAKILAFIDNSPDDLEVSIIAKSEEELLKGMVLMQDLRLSGVITDLNKNNAKINIILNDDKLQRGLITVKDMLINEETTVAEDEIIEYILGVI